MTLATRYKEKKLVEKEPYHKLNTHITIYIILIGCLGVATATLISIVYGSANFMTPFSSSPSSEKLATYLGSVSSFVISSNSLPVDRASVVVYKHMGLMDSDKNADYFASVVTEPDGSFVLSDLPSGVYKITVTNSTGTIQTINNYAVWPSSASSYVFVA